VQQFLEDLRKARELRKKREKQKQKELRDLLLKSIKHERNVQSNQSLRLQYEPDRAPPSLQQFAKAQQPASSARPTFKRGW